ncbi:MAG TPA: putative quinol monooxygenase [Chlorobaculum sp.]|nr:putative quinol monooxygenase [Chlorobaculum sp.]
MSPLIVIATVVANKESAQQLKGELLKLVAPTRKEEGCINYTLHQDNRDPAVFIFYETWKSAGHLEKHLASEHYRAYVRDAEGLIAGKAVNKLTLVG